MTLSEKLDGWRMNGSGRSVEIETKWVYQPAIDEWSGFESQMYYVCTVTDASLFPATSVTWESTDMRNAVLGALDEFDRIKAELGKPR